MVMVDGRFFSKTEEQNAAFVAVVGDDLKNNLFPSGASPVGKTFKIQGLEFTVVGVQERLGSSFGRSQDNAAMIPVSTFNQLFGPGRSIAIFGRPRPSSGESMQQALDLTRCGAARQVPSETRGGGPVRLSSLRMRSARSSTIFFRWWLPSWYRLRASLSW